MGESLKATSRIDWHSHGATATADEVRLGALLRIADAVELMAKSYVNLINDRDRHKRRAEDHEATAERINRSNIALRGVITRMKRKAKS